MCSFTFSVPGEREVRPDLAKRSGITPRKEERYPVETSVERLGCGLAFPVDAAAFYFALSAPRAPPFVSLPERLLFFFPEAKWLVVVREGERRRWRK